MLLVGGGGQVTKEGPRLGIAARGLRRSSSQLFELGARVDRKAVILALGDHQPSCQRITELGGQREPPLVVEPRRVGAEKHPATSHHSVESRVASLRRTELRSLRCPPLYPTIPHNAPFGSKSWSDVPTTAHHSGAFPGRPGRTGRCSSEKPQVKAVNRVGGARWGNPRHESAQERDTKAHK